MNLYGTILHSPTLTTASLFSTATGGTETTTTTTNAGSASVPYSEVWSQGNSNYTSYQASIPAPTGHGWVYSAGAGSFVTGVWSAKADITLYCPANSSLTMRQYKRSNSGVYTLVGTLTAPLVASGSGPSRQTATFAGVSFSAMSFLLTDLLYTDLWLYDPTYPGGDNPTIYLGNNQGVTGDMALVTSAFTQRRNVIRHKAFGRIR